nr:hypothetical protein [Deinococcus alpinitundrae]
MSVDAGDLDDHPAPLRHHPLEGLLGAQKSPEQVDADYLQPGDRIGLPAQGVRVIDARVVDQKVEAAVVGVDLLEHGGHLRRVAHVGQHRERLAARCCNVGSDLVGGFRLRDMIDDDPRSGGSQPAHHRFPDSRVGPDDQGTPTLQGNVHGPQLVAGRGEKR